jgi:hypothetical protein
VSVDFPASALDNYCSDSVGLGIMTLRWWAAEMLRHYLKAAVKDSPPRNAI